MSKQTRIKVVVGAGGVGKTTVSSAMGLAYARQGHRVLVITVDPARRLMDALGLGNTSKKSRSRHVIKVGEQGGSLTAYMPDLKSEWLDFLKSSLSDKKSVHDISRNHFYQYLVDGLPGALEIICSHVLFRELQGQTYDYVILDTPPTAQSLAFFDVPRQVTALLEKNLFRAFFRKRTFLGFTKKIALFSSTMIEKTLERLIGSHFLSELLDFALTVDALYEPLLTRTRATERLFKSPNTEFVLVVRPTTQSVADAHTLKRELSLRQLSISQVMVNQVLFGVDKAKLVTELAGLKASENFSFAKDLVDRFAMRTSYEEKLLENINGFFSKITVTKLAVEPVVAGHRELLDALATALMEGKS